MNTRPGLVLMLQEERRAHAVTSDHLAAKSRLVIDQAARIRELDPYMGSGTFLEAAKMLGFHGYGIDFTLEFCARSAARVSQAELIPAPEAPTTTAALSL